MKRKLLCPGFLLVIIFLASCASTKTGTVPPDTTLTPTAEQNATALTPAKQKESFFEGIDESVVSKVKNGTKADLQSALGSIKKSAESYTDNEIVLITIIQGLQSIVYNETVAAVDISSSTVINPYTASLDSAKKGVYDFSAGDSDFFTLMLPSLVLLTAPSLQNYYEEASLSLEKALTLENGSFLALYLYALVSERSGNKEKALSCYEKAYSQDSSYISLDRQYMKLLYDTGDAGTSLHVAQSLLTLSSGDLEALKICSLISYSNKNYDAAEQYVAQVLQKEPDNNEYILFRARILMDKGDYIRVSSLLDLYARTDKTGKEYLLLRARLQRDWNKNTAASSNTIQEALTLYPSDIDVLLLAASLSAQSGQKIGKLTLQELLSQILSQDPENSEALQLTVNEYVRQQNWEQAYEYSTKIIARKTFSSSILFSHFEICIHLGELREAGEIYTMLSETDADVNEVSLVKIKLSIAQGRADEARSLIESMLSSNPVSRIKSILYYERSRIATGDEAKLADLRASLTSNPRNDEALFALYELYFEKKDYRKAQYYLKQVVSLNSTDQRLLKLNEEIEKLLAN